MTTTMHDITSLTRNLLLIRHMATTM